MPSRLDIPPIYFVASALLMLVLHLGLPGPQLVAGVALAIACERAFKHGDAAVLPFSESSVLVTGGPFAATRNPMYIGLVLCLLGWAVLLSPRPVRPRRRALKGI